MFRNLAVACSALLILIPLVPAATAGGFAVVALEDDVATVTVNQENIVLFQVLAHNRPEAPQPNMNTVFEFTHKESGFQLRVAGLPTGDPFVYSLRIHLDRAGEWEWNAIIRNYLPAGEIVTLFPDILAIEATPSATPTGVDDPYATGWAVVVLDEALTTATVGEDSVVPFRVLHLGRVDSEVADAIVVFTILHAQTGESITEIAQLLDDRTDYEATFTLQREGDWEWTAFVYNTGNMNPQATRLPSFVAVEPGAVVLDSASVAATPVPDGPGYVRIENDRLDPWHLVVPLGLKVHFENNSPYAIRIFQDGSTFHGPAALFPDHSTMWYSLVPGDYLFVTGPAPAFMVGTITVLDEP